MMTQPLPPDHLSQESPAPQRYIDFPYFPDVTACKDELAITSRNTWIQIVSGYSVEPYHKVVLALEELECVSQ